jgi:outer membrane protein
MTRRGARTRACRVDTRVDARRAVHHASNCEVNSALKLSPCLAARCRVGAAHAQPSAIAPQKPAAPGILRPYMATVVPPIRPSNSPRLADLVRAGTLYLTVQDTIALVLENNIDLEIARYNPILAQWRVTRAEAGGALPGVPNNAAQAGAVAVGQGVTGSQQAAGVRIISTGSASGSGTNASISQIGPVAQTLDPTVQEASTFSHTTTPEPNIVQSVTPILVTDTRAHSATYQEGFLSGGSATLSYTENYLRENSPTDLLNPSSAPNLSVAFQHNLLRGFGAAVNGRGIAGAKIGVNISDLTFKTQVSGIGTQALAYYYNLAAALDDVKAKQSAAEIARTLLADVQGRIRLGSVAPPEAIAAESLVVTSAQALVDSQTSLRQQEVRLKNLLSRTGTADPALAGAHILPVDPIAIPPRDDLPPLADMLQQALANRSDLAATRESNRAS